MLNKTIKYVFFDVGTTLMDETEAYNHRIRDAIAGTDISFEQFQEKRIFFARQNLKGDLEAIQYFGLTKTPWHNEDEVPYPDAKDMLQYLHSKGYGIGIIANQTLGTKDRLQKWGLLPCIDLIFASAEMGLAKPDPRIFEQAIKRSGCIPSETVMIGDRLDNDIRPAKKLGMGTIWARQGFAIYQNPDSPDCIPDCIINCLSELKNIL